MEVIFFGGEVTNLHFSNRSDESGRRVMVPVTEKFVVMMMTRMVVVEEKG